jgi:hypothetical protein
VKCLGLETWLYIGGGKIEEYLMRDLVLDLSEAKYYT